MKEKVESWIDVEKWYKPIEDKLVNEFRGFCNIYRQFVCEANKFL